MASSWTVYFPGVQFAVGKIMAGIANTGTRNIKIRRVRFLNAQAIAVAGQVCCGELRRYTGASWSSYSNVDPFAHDTENSALQNLQSGTAGSVTGTYQVLRSYIWSSDEPSVGGATTDEWETITPLNIVWELGFGDPNVTALTLRQNEFFCVYNLSGTAGNIDIWITFTDEA